MRGKDNKFMVNKEKMRITPAYAGKSKECHEIYRTYWDHPRLCGEKLKYCTRKEDDVGSPPPMRGKVEAF